MISNNIKKCTVSSLSKYIQVIENNDLFDFISRGENHNYDTKLTAGIFRNKLKDHQKILDEYHFEVESNINSIQNKHFLAFAQHHGLATNLLDFSFNPLVSLYFSVDGCKDKGYVYFIKKSKTISIDKVITKKPLGWGLFDDLFTCDELLYKNIMYEMGESFELNYNDMIKHFEEHLESFIKSHKKVKLTFDSKYLTEDLEKAYGKYKEYKEQYIRQENITEINRLQIYDSVNLFLKGMISSFDGLIENIDCFIRSFNKLSFEKYHDHHSDVILMLSLLKMEELESFIYNDFIYENILELPFYYTYRPPVIDERVKNQLSIFILQPSCVSMKIENKYDVVTRQEIIPDFIIEIDNPKNIMRELDCIGYNQKYIYCDYDSVAKYLINKF